MLSDVGAAQPKPAWRSSGDGSPVCHRTAPLSIWTSVVVDLGEIGLYGHPVLKAGSGRQGLQVEGIAGLCVIRLWLVASGEKKTVGAKALIPTLLALAT